MSVRIKQYKFFRSLSVKVNDNWPVRKAEQIWRQLRAHKIAEIEATEACKWLRAAGFPQYAQMYEDMQFPIEVAAVEQDHPLLESSVLHSLYRRLHILNKCAQFHQQRVSRSDDSEDEQCALSENWAYQKDIRRWSRTVDLENEEETASLGTESESLRRGSYQKEEEIPESPRNKFKRVISPSCRRRRNEIVNNNSGLNVLDLLSKQLNDFSTSGNPVLDPESPFRRSRRRKTGSFDKTETWLQLTNPNDTLLWPSHQTSEDFDEVPTEIEEGGRPIYTLSANQLQVLRKLALLKLTAHMEKYCPTHKTGWNWDISKFIRKIKCPAYKDKLIFGVPITVIVQKTGLPLPKGIEEALIWLVKNAANNVGIFRKPGVRSRIQHLKTVIEEYGENINFNDHQAYDVADTVKQYFRELPEAVLTNKLSETFISIFQHIPIQLRKEAVLCGLLLMPDEHRQVLEVLLNFLSKIAEYSSENQMNESNLALCFAPTLFHHNQVVNRQVTGIPHPKELDENKAAHECLLFLIKNFDKLFHVPTDLLNQCNFSEVKLVPLSVENNDEWRSYLEKCQSALLNEVKEKARGWILIPSHFEKIEISYKKVADSHPLRLWKITIEVDASPIEILNRLLKERHLWDEELDSTRTISQVDECTDIFQYTRRNVNPLPLEDYCVIRSWKKDIGKGGCLLVETSVEHKDSMTIPNSVRGIVLASRYLIEPSGSHSSKIIHMSRVDVKGKMPEWYHKHFGHLRAQHIYNLHNTFKKQSKK
nr:rho GTPase-activating protein 7 isoform X2 [Onthophagus taurus]